MPEHSGKADSAAAAADDSDSLTVNQGDGQSDVEGEEEEEMREEGEEEEEEEEEVEEDDEALDGEEEDVEAVEEEDGLDGEYEEFEEEDEVGDTEDEESEEMEADGGDFEHEEAEEAGEEEEMEGGDDEEQEFKEVEEEDGGNSGEDEMEEEEEEIEEKEEGDGKGDEETGTGTVEAATIMQETAEAAITVQETAEAAISVQETAEAAITVQEPAEAAATVQEDAKDFCEMVKSGRHDQSSTAGDYNAGKHHEPDISNKFSTYSKVFSSTSMGNENSAMADKPVLSKENGFPDASLGGTYNGIQLGKQISNEAPKSMKNNNLETHGSNPSLATGNASSLLLQKSDLAVEGSIRSESEIVKNGVSVTEESHLHGITDSQKLDDSNLTCVHTPQRRPRSSSPGVEPDTVNKKPAVTCVFYARGWCISGKACKFLHQKDSATTTEQHNKEDKAGHNWISDSRGITEEIVEGSKVSSVGLEESNAEGSSKSNSLLQRALVRTYGTGSHETSQLHGQYNIQAKGEFQQPDHFQAARALVQEDYGRNFGKISHVDSVERQLSDGAFSSRRHLAEEKLVNEFPREDSPYETKFSRSTHLVDAFAPEYKTYFGSSSKVSSLHQNSPSAYGRTEGIASRSAHSHFPNQESYNSHSLSGSRYSGLSSAFQFSQSDNKFARAETSPKRNSNPSIEYLDDHTNRGYLGSRSVSFARDSSPYRSRLDLQYMTHPGDLTSRQKTKFQCNDWEPSQPFRPSLSIATSSITSPGSQYDPILDSIEPANASTRDYCFQTSQRTSFQNASCWPTNIDTILNGTVTAVSPTFEGTLTKKVSLNDSSAHANVDVLFGSSKLERGDNSIPRNEKTWNPDHLVERSNIKDAEFGGDCRNRADKSRNKESKALKIFHAALVDFMKELVKPWWREGQLSKDAHKAVIKKSVEKVLSAVQPHQVPSTQDAINQYLATSRQKLLKLVEGYVQKYANA